MQAIEVRGRRHGAAVLRRAIPLLAVLALWTGPGHARPDYPVLNEILYDGPGTDADDVFTEIVGPPGLSLAGWSLVGINGDDGSTYRCVTLVAAQIPADGVLVVATADATPELAAVRDVIGAVDWQNGPDAVQLRDATDQIVDAVQYGQAAYPAGEGDPAALTPAGASLSRDANSADTQDNAADFSVCAVPTPGVAGGGSGGGGTQSPAPALRLSVADATARPREQVAVAVHYDASEDTAGVVALDANLVFDGRVMSIAGAQLGQGLATGNWSLAYRVWTGAPGSADTLAFSLATAADTLAGAGELLTLVVAAADTADYAWSPLDLHLVAVNADTAAGQCDPGVFALRGVDADVAAVATPDDSLRVSIVDPDEDRRPAAQDSVPFVVAVGACLDTLTAWETGVASGSFATAVPLVRAAPVCGNGVVEVTPDSSLTVRYWDRLTADGPGVVRHASVAVRWNADARVQASRLVQAGDTLHVRLLDRGANTRPDTRDTVWVRATNRRTLECELAALVEAQPDDSLFVGMLRVVGAPALAGDGLLAAAAGDSLRVALVDSSTCGGDGGVCASDVLAVRPFGDVDANGLIQAYDASRVLVHVLEPQLAGADSLAANLDALAPDGPITPLDAALILQQRVRLLSRFPVQTAASRNQPWWSPAGRPASAQPRLVWRSEADRLALFLDDRAGLVCGDLRVEGITGEVELPADLQDFLVAVRPSGQGMRIVLAGPRPVFGPGEVLAVLPDRMVETLPTVVGSFDDGRIDLSAAHLALGAQPTSCWILANHPNPFNASTQIGYYLAEDGQAVLTVLDVLGRPVCTLVRGYRNRGYHVATWDGRDEHGRPAGTGVYLSRLQAGSRQWSQPMLLLR